MKGILVLLGFVAVCWAQSCDNSIGTYLNNLKDEMSSDDSTALAMETENKDDYRKLVRGCFDDNTGGSKCALTDDELDGDVYGDVGPLKDCAGCKKLATGFRDKFLKSSSETRTCFRRRFAEAIRQELEPCIQGKLNDFNFHVPKIPDFDTLTFNHINVVEKGLSYHIMAYHRLDQCKNANPGKYSSTQSCLNAEYDGIYSKHCQAAKNAKAKTLTGTSNCGGRFSQLKGATCQCLRDKKEEWHNKFAKVRTIIDNSGSGDECADKIYNEVGSWLNQLQDALNECLPAEDKKQIGDLRTKISLGCGQVLSGNIKKDDVISGFRFVRYLLEGLNDRILLFCDNKCKF